MKDPKYGTMKKKVVFYDSDKRYAELKVRLKHDGISQAHFFRGVLTGYLSQDEDVLNFVDKLKASKNHGNSSKSCIKKDRLLIKDGKEKASWCGIYKGAEEFAKENNFYWFYTLEGRHGDDNAGLDNPSYFTFKQI